MRIVRFLVVLSATALTALPPLGGAEVSPPATLDPRPSTLDSRDTSRQKPDGLDSKVQRFLQDNRGSWRDMNVPEADGRALHDLIVERSFKRALEIGTSTGHSGVWMGWALSKTGGKLVTIDIDEGRHREAIRNFQEAGVAPFIEARLADAHDLVPKLEGPWDFVFIDADKEWYTNYAKAVLPKLRVGGCLTAHNVSPGRGRRQMSGDFYEYVTSLPFLETSFRAGVFVACRTKA